MYRSKGIDYRPARNLYKIRTTGSPWRFYGGVPQAVWYGVRVSPPPQQTQDELSYPPHLQRKKTASWTWHQDSHTQRVLWWNGKKGTHQERNHRGGRADTKRLHRHKKGEVYESHLFTVKDDKFKSEPFLREVKEIYTDLINRHISDPEQQLKVFDKNSVYLPTKKIGKNNPKAAEIEPDNTARQNPAKL